MLQSFHGKPNESALVLSYLIVLMPNRSTYCSKIIHPSMESVSKLFCFGTLYNITALLLQQILTYYYKVKMTPVYKLRTFDEGLEMTQRGLSSSAPFTPMFSSLRVEHSHSAAAATIKTNRVDASTAPAEVSAVHVLDGSSPPGGDGDGGGGGGVVSSDKPSLSTAAADHSPIVE
ncbi:hypothetical protein AGLY_005922 [Aphis glycines]|uniref:Uncharacterized protein n=1 Tax=Aphis glycines TaxID=307491 RepID=A0A6G0TT70_APHGL|nr:hypothetical protein AGLY_005922 [Aphis glycines]